MVPQLKLIICRDLRRKSFSIQTSRWFGCEARICRNASLSSSSWQGSMAETRTPVMQSAAFGMQSAAFGMQSAAFGMQHRAVPTHMGMQRRFLTSLHANLQCHISSTENWLHTQKRCTTKNISGPKFWRSRRKKVPQYKFNWRSKWLEGSASRKGVCVRVRVINPRKPNSGLRKIARVQLPNKRIVRAHIPGMGHNLQAHSVVLVKGGRTNDVIGCNYKLIRGKYDLLPVKGRLRRRSRYGVKRPNIVPPNTSKERWKWIGTTDYEKELYFKRTGKETTDVNSDGELEVKRPPWPLQRKKPILVGGYGRKKA